jgi:hypothetical protein
MGLATLRASVLAALTAAAGHSAVNKQVVGEGPAKPD